MAAILNYAVLNKMNDLAEELTNIYSNDDWFFLWNMFLWGFFRVLGNWLLLMVEWMGDHGSS